jgi:hypothetical protein
MPKLNLDDFDGQIIAGMFMDAPPPGSVKMPCELCGGSATIGPTQQRVMAENPTRRFLVICPPCIFLNAKALGLGAETSVHQAKDAL